MTCSFDCRLTIYDIGLTLLGLVDTFTASFAGHPGGSVALRDSMRNSSAPYLQPGETVQAVFGAQTASQYLAAIGGIFVFLGLNHYRIFVVTPQRVVILDAGKTSMKKARGVVAELPRSTRLGPGSGIWHVIPVGTEKLRVHRRFFKDLETADAGAAAA
jgi:hypothetical protein